MRTSRKQMLLAMACVAAVLALAGVAMVWRAGGRVQSLTVSLSALDHPVTTMTLAKRGTQETLHIVSGDDGQILAFSGRDLAGTRCAIAWDAQKNVFREPCRGTVFNLQGQVIAGPGPYNMALFPTRVQYRKLVVDLSAPPTP